jgi:chemotaxis protein MotA
MGFIGLIILFGCVFGGYVMSGGTFGVFMHPNEYIIIFGASLGATIISTPVKYLKDVFVYALKSLSIHDPAKKEFIEVLSLMNELFQAQKKEGIQAIEGHIENPEQSKIFSKYPSILKNHHVLHFLTDSMRTFISGGPSPYDMDDLLVADLDAAHKEEHKIPSTIQTAADGFPAIGIVAAVCGIIVTMNSIAAGPEVVGAKVAAALVGTFLGIFVGYGFVSPMAKRLEHHFEAEGQFFTCVKNGILANCRGLPPQISVEFARRSIPPSERPSFHDLEELMKNAAAKKAA